MISSQLILTSWYVSDICPSFFLPLSLSGTTCVRMQYEKLYVINDIKKYFVKRSKCYIFLNPQWYLVLNIYSEVFSPTQDLQI